MIRRAITYGLLATGGVAAWTILEFALGWHESRADVGRYTAWLALLPPIVAIVFGLRAARRERADGLSFGAGMAEGTGMSLVFAVAVTIFYYLYFSAINPGYNDAGAPVDPFRTAKAALGASMATGLLITVIAAAIFRTRAPQPVVAP